MSPCLPTIIVGTGRQQFSCRRSVKREEIQAPAGARKNVSILLLCPPGIATMRPMWTTPRAEKNVNARANGIITIIISVIVDWRVARPSSPHCRRFKSHRMAKPSRRAKLFASSSSSVLLSSSLSVLNASRKRHDGDLHRAASINAATVSPVQTTPNSFTFDSLLAAAMGVPTSSPCTFRFCKPRLPLACTSLHTSLRVKRVDPVSTRIMEDSGLAAKLADLSRLPSIAYLGVRLSYSRALLLPHSHRHYSQALLNCACDRRCPRALSGPSFVLSALGLDRSTCSPLDCDQAGCVLLCRKSVTLATARQDFFCPGCTQQTEAELALAGRLMQRTSGKQSLT
ncbi:hypothetical protein IWX90DRAFT_315461 [Phyllosticta citrichinensis]|uniref:Uncharacterized protein n=1 Tax=Phyllosticta citrichinensis TaxID=1130410 RepID=A0ABR1XJ25_9PEZI